MHPAVALPFEPVRRIYVPALSVVHLIDTRDIIRVQSMSNYSKLFFSNGKTLVVAKVLRWFENQLSGDGFIRVHRTHLVNLSYIRQYSFREDCRKLELTNGEFIDVSRRKTDSLKLIRPDAY